MNAGVTPLHPGEQPDRPGWYLVEDDNLDRFVVQVIPCGRELRVFEVEAVDTFPVGTYENLFLARLDLAALLPTRTGSTGRGGDGAASSLRISGRDS